MRTNYKLQITKLQSNFPSNYKFFIFIFMLFTLNLSLLTNSYAKVYINITSPAFRKLPISISYTGAEQVKEIREIVENDLNFTGIFYPIDPDISGAEIKVKINAEVSEEIKADVIVFDLIENKEILSKRFKARKKILRALAHSISNNIFEAITGKKGGFRTKIAYIRSPSNDKKWLYLMDWDGHNAVRVVSKGLTFSHSWSRDGRHISYSSERNRRWGIYLLNLRNYMEKILFSSKGLNLVGGTSRDGRIAFSSSKDGSPEIYIMNINGTGSKKITKSFGIDVSPVFSPDGSRIAFVSDRGGSPQIYIMDSDGRRLRRLTFKGSYNTSPAWTPDGKWIAYVGRRNGKNQIFVIKFDGNDLRQLTDNGNNENPTFSPEGLFIAFDSDRDGARGIYVMNLKTWVLKRITPKGTQAMNPKWSPYIK